MDTKRLLLAMIVSLGLLAAWMYFFGEGGKTKDNESTVSKEKSKTAKKSQEKRIDSEEQEEKKKVSKDRLKKDEGERSKEKPKSQISSSKKKIVPERLTLVEGSLYKAEFSTGGGVLRSFSLKGEQFKEEKGGKTVPVDLVRTKQVENLPLKVTFHESSFSVRDPQQWKAVKRTQSGWVAVKESEPHLRKLDNKAVEVAYQLELVEQGVILTKVFKLEPNEEYHFQMDVRVQNLSEEKKKVKMTVAVPAMDFGEKGKSFFQPISLKREAICLVNGEVMVRTYDHIRGKEEKGCGGGCGGCSCRRTPAEGNSFAGEMKWGGIDESYFLLAVAPIDREESSQCRFGAMKTPRGGLMWTDLNFPEESVGEKEEIVRKFVVYAGPKDVDLLAKAGGKINFDESVDFGILWFLGKPMLWMMRFFYRFVGNWGIAIILITILIKLVTLYWNTKSMRSMKEMQKLKPLMDELKKKYGEDKQRYQQEMAKLWKRHKINPLGGCLPMVFQMPIYIAWYQALMSAVELYRAPFFGWLKDLTSPDPYYIMPIVMGAAMFAQQKMSPATSDNPQAKMMMYMMPGMFTFFMLFLPSGLTLYILVNVLLSLVHQWYLNHSQ